MDEELKLEAEIMLNEELKLEIEAVLNTIAKLEQDNKRLKEQVSEKQNG